MLLVGKHPSFAILNVPFRMVIENTVLMVT